MRGSQTGSALVETAVALPIILLLVFSAFQVLFLITAGILVDQAAHEAARTAAVHDDPELPKGRAQRLLSGLPSGPGFLASAPEYEIEYGGTAVTVRVTVVISMLPFVKQAYQGAGGRGTVSISAKARARRGPQP